MSFPEPSEVRCLLVRLSSPAGSPASLLASGDRRRPSKHQWCRSPSALREHRLSTQRVQRPAHIRHLSTSGKRPQRTLARKDERHPRWLRAALDTPWRCPPPAAPTQVPKEETQFSGHEKGAAEPRYTSIITPLITICQLPLHNDTAHLCAYVVSGESARIGNWE